MEVVLLDNIKLPTYTVIIEYASISFMVFFLLTYILKPFASRVGLVDIPGGRKWHHSETPLIGGIIIFLIFLFSILATPIPVNGFYGLIISSFILLFVGIMDDINPLGSKRRLLCHILASLLIIGIDHKNISSLGNILTTGSLHLGPLSTAFTCLMTIGFINAMNMIDGQDGLAGSVALTQTLSLLLLSILEQKQVNITILSTFACLITCFLLYNFPFPWRSKARMFLGDSGSTFIALIISWFAIDLTQQSAQHKIPPISILWIVSLPLFDLLNVFIYRIRRGISPFRAGREHLHHIIQSKNISTSLSTTLLCLLSLAFSAAGMFTYLFRVEESISFALYLLILTLYLRFIKILRKDTQ